MKKILTRRPGEKIWRSVGAVAIRYGCHPRTISRWVADPNVGFPAPELVINKIRHWSDEALDAFDARQKQNGPRQEAS